MENWTCDPVYKAVLQHPDWKESVGRIKEWEGTYMGGHMQQNEVFGLMSEILNNLIGIKSITDIPDTRWYGISNKLIEVALEG